MLFNRQGLQQKNWRMVKKGKHILFGCSLFFVVGGMSISGSQVTYAGDVNGSEIVVKQEKNSNIGEGNSHTVMPMLEKEKQIKSSSNKMAEKITTNEIVGLPIDKKEVNKKELKDLVDKIKKTDISKKTEKSVKELSLILSRAEKALDNKEITQEEIDKEVKALNEVFEKLEDKPKEDKKSEAKEKVESKKEEQSNVEKNTKEKQQENSTDDVARKHNEKITKVTETVNEIHSIANQINYEFSDAEKELVETADKLPTTNNSEESIQKLLNEVIYLRNKVANRMTREHSGKRDARNGKMIENGGESTFRGIRFTPLENAQNGKVVSNADTNLTYFNSDNFWVKIQVKGEKFRHDSANTFYLVKKVTLSGKPFKDLSIIVSSGRGDLRAATTIDNINNPNVQAGILGNIGSNGIIKPGNYQVVLTVNDTVSPANNYNIIYNITIKPQSERNTVRDLTLTYVDDVRHLTEAERTALIEKFKAEHPDVANRAHHIDFERAEVSADGTTMTIHFKDGFNPKTIQTNATNDVEAKHSSLTAYFGDSKELYTNPRELVRSKTGNEVPTTAQVTYKTPFNLQQVGTRNVVVTTTYGNGVTKDVTTPYTVLDFIGKQDKKINQNQSGQLGDARNYITVSDNSALPGEFTIRWKGGSSTVDTSAAGVQHKEIEILRGNHLMKTVTIPVEIVDNINPTITAPDSVLLTRLEGLPSVINISAQDNNKGVGLKDGNAVTVENLPAPLMYNAAKSKIEINGVIPNNFQLGKSSIQVTVKAVDKKGNTATKNITFNIQSQTQKYTAVANPSIQEASYGGTPDAGTSIQKNGLPTETRYSWATKPSTTTGPGDKVGVVTVTYPDGSTDTVTVTVKVRKLSDEHEPIATKIVKNQNDTVSNNDLKASITINNNGNSKVKSVTPVGNISTTNAGAQTINATVTYLDDTTDSVSIPLEVKDVTAPTIQTPIDRQNWDLIALDRTLPSITVTSVDNNGGTGVKSTTVTGLPDFLVYDNATKTIKFKNGVQEVSKLPAGEDSKTYDVNIQVTDNSNNSSQRRVTITVKSMTTKYTAIPDSQKQTVSYGEMPDAGTSINKRGLPIGTTYTWATPPSTVTGPGEKAGVVTVTYPDGSKDTVDVTVVVRKLSDEYNVAGTQIEVNQNDPVTNDDLKAKVTATSKEGNVNGTDKIAKVEPKAQISTVAYGETNIEATVTFKDGTTKEVTIPLKVKDVTKPTIQTPVENTNWEMTALDKTLPNMEIRAEDNANGSGIKTVSVTGLPDYLEYDSATNTIKFKTGKQEVEKLPENTPSKEFTLNIRAEDNAGNVSERTAKITVSSMSEKTNPTPIPQNTSYGQVPAPNASVDKAGLPEGTNVTWKTPPVVTVPGTTTGVVEVTYPDGSKDTVEVTVNVSKLSDEYNVAGTQIEVNQNDPVTNDDLKAKVTATSKEGNVNGTDKIAKVEPKAQISTVAYGETNIEATVTFKDGTTKEVTIPLKVKDVTKPTIQTPVENTNWEMTALDKTLPNMEIRAEDNANGSGIKTVSVTGLPDYLEYDSATNTIKFKTGKQEVEKLPENTPSKEFTLNIRAEDNAGNVSERTAKITVSSMSEKTNPTPIPQNTSYGQVPAPNASVDKAGLPEGTNVTWKTPPVVTVPGTTTGVVEVTYPDGSKDTVEVTVNVSKLSDEYNVAGTQIEVNQNDPVTNDDLKAKVTATSKEGNVNGTDKIAKVEPKAQISTVAYGETNIEATVTFKDGTTKEVTIPLKVKDVTKPTIQTPVENTNWEMTALDKTLPNMEIRAEDNANGSGIKTVSVTGLPDYLEYDSATNTIKFKTGKQEVEKLPENTPSKEFTLNIRAEDNAGNVSERTAKITVSSMSEKTNPTPIPQNTSYGQVPAPNASVDKAGLPEGTNVTWKTPPVVTVPGTTTGVVEVTYPDGSKDTVEVTVNVSKLSDEYNVAGTQIEVNQNDPVTNDDLKAKVTATSKEGNVNGTDKIAKVEPKAQISTVAYGETNIEATVTFKDGTTKEVTIPLKVKDVTKPTIQTPVENTNWEMTALDKTLPNMEIRAEDNANGSGIKTVSVTGLPDYLEYDSATNTIKFKTGKQEVEKLPENTPSKEFTLNIRAEDNAGNVSERTAKITVSSMSEKTNPTPIPQNTSYGQVPAPNASVDKAGLPEGTNVTWKTPPVVTVPGTTTGVVEVTYPDGSKDTVEVTVNVSKLSDEYNVAGTQIEVNQNDPVTNDDLKAKVTATSKEGNVNGTDKIAKVEPKAQISTVAYGETNIEATVTFKDGTTKEVTIPLKVKDVTKPTIQTPVENTNWEMTALDKTLPNMEIRAEDNANGSGIKTVSVTGLPDYLEYDSATNTIKFKTGKQEVEKLPENTPSKEFTLNIRAEDNAGNVSERTAKITVSSMSEKTNPTPIPQNTSYGQVPAPNASVDKAGLPEGTNVTWKTPPVVTVPGTTTGVVEVTYPDGSKDTVEVTVNVSKLSDEYNVAGTQIEVNQNDPVTNDDLKAKVTATSKEGNVNGTDKIAKVEPKAQISTVAYGETNIEATVTFKDGTTKEVTIPLKVKDVTKPTIQTPVENTNWEMTALDKTLPNMEIRAEDNANGSGIKTVSVTGLPDYLEYDSATNTIKFKTGKQEVEKLPENTPSKEFTLNIRAEDNAGNVSERTAKITVSSMSEKTNPTPIPQNTSYGQVPAPNASVDKAGLPEGTNVTWKTPPVVTVPGTTTGVVEVTYPDGSKDTVEVTVNVSKLSDEYNVAGTQIEVNQNDPVTNDDLKAKVTATSKEGNVNGTDKIAKVEPKAQISTVAYGETNIEATVTFKDGTTKEVTIPLKVKDVTKPTIQTPVENTNWEMTALDKTLPNMEIRAEDNANGSGIKTVSVTGLPDYLEYDSATNTIKFKTGKQEVEKLPENTPSKEFTLNIRAEDNAGNVSERTAKITVSSMSEKTNPTPIPQNTSYGQVPAPNASVDKAGLPEGTNVTWKTPPVVTVPGTTTGVVEVTYPDGSKDTVEVTVNVSKLSDEYNVAGTQIEVNQNDPVTNDDLKAKVTATSKEGNVNGTDKIAKVEPKAQISTVAYGETNIEATVTFKDGTTKEVTIPLKVKDVTKPTIQTPVENTNWEMTALDKTLPNMEIRAEDNANGSGIKTVSVTGLPDYLEYDSATNTIKFKTGKQEVEKLPENTPSKEFTLNIRAEDNAGNVSERTAKITVSSMSEKTNPTPIPQNTSYGQVPAPNASVDKAGLPEGTNVTWKTPPVVTVPGTTTGVVEVTYPDGSKDTVEVTVNVSKLSDEYNVAGTQIEVNQNDPVTNDDLKAKVTATSKEGNVNGTDKIAKVEPKAQISTVAYGETNIEATVTFKDGTTKEVTIPLKVKDVTKPTIQTPVENTNWEMTALDKTLPNMEIRAEDNANGSGIKTVSVTGLPDYLEYDSATNTIKFKTGKQEVEKLPENTPSKEFTLNIRAEDNAGNVSERTAKITVSSMSEKTNPTPIPQNTSYGQVPAPNASVDKAGLPEGTNVTWKTPPVVTVPGTTTGVVEVTYPDGSKDTVEVTVNVSKLSDEYNVAGTQIEVNQNDPVTNDDLKAKVTATSKEGNVNGTDKIAKVEPKAQISTVAYGETNIEATVTFKDGTTKEVTIPLKVKDVTKPTIQTPVENTNWEMTALDKTLPNMEIRAEDNANGSGIKTVSVTGLPDYLEYDSATNTIKFKTGKQEVEKLPENTPSKEFTLNIRAEDNAGNVSERTAKITVSSMSEKTNPTPIPQNTSYGQVPAPNASVDKAGLPEGTNVTWKTPPVVTVPGTTTGVVEVTYPDGSKDTVEVTVNVSKLSDEYNVAGTQIEVNQNDPVTNDDLKAKVTATSKEGNVNGTDKIAKVEPKAQISTVAYGETNIEATVTFKDGTTKEVTIPLKVKDVTKPTIQTPVENTNWEMTALDKTLPNMEIRAEDNANGSGIKTVSVTGLPDYLEYDSATNTIKFKTGKQEVEKLPENTPSKEFTLNIRAEDNAGNVSERTAKITVSSMSEKTNPTPIPQNTSYGQVPAPNASVDKAGLPEGTNVTWKTPPVVTVPGTTTGVVEVTYPDGSKDTVEVTVNVSKLSDEYNVAGTQIEVNQNDPVTNDDLKAKVTATSKEGNVNGTDKIAKVEPKAQISTVAYGETNIEATVTFKDGTTKEVTIPLKVKDVTKPTIQTPVENTNWEMTALDKTLPNMEIRAEDNANGSGIKTVSVTGLPDYLEYDSATNTIKFKTGKQEVEKLPENTPSKEFTLNIRAEDNAGNVSERTAKITVSSMSEKTNPTPIPQNTSYGQVPAPNASVDKAGLPEGTNVTWKTPPVVTVPGTTTGVVEVTYPDGSKDTVEVTVNVSKLSDEYNVAGTQIEVNQNDPVTNDDLKAKVTATSKEGNVNGTDKIAKVEPKAQISTVAYGETNIEATVTFKDGTTKEVTIPLKVKDVTKPTIQTPVENTNWEMTALDKTLPNMEIRAEDNANGSGIKTVSVTGLPDYLEYDSATNTIKFKTGKQEVEKLPENTPSKEFTLNIRAEDNAGNVSERTAKITVSSMSEKTNPTPIPQNTSYGQVPAPNASVDKAGLPEGTNVTWKTPPVVTVPGTTTGVVEVTYPDGSKDTVEVTVNVSKLSDEYNVAGTQIEVNQNDPVTNDDLKAKVTATSKEGNVNGTDKIAKVEPKAQISTVAYGETNIEATVTFKDGTTKEVTIPLKVKDVTKPTIQTPVENTNWEMTALDKTLPNMEIRAEDNANGSGIKTVSVTGLPDYLEYDSATNTIKFKTGKQEVEKLPENTPSKEFTLNIRAEDNAGNVSERTAKITVSSMSEKTNPTPIPQNTSYGQVPAPNASVDKAGLPEGTNVTWKTPPVVTVPGTTTGVVEVTYPDGSKDTVEVTVNVSKLSDEYNVAGTQIEVNQNDPVTNDDLKAKVTATSKEGNVNGTDKIAKVEPKAQISTVAYGETNIEATVTFKDGTTKEVTIPLKVKDVTKPTIQTPVENTNWEMTALDKTLPNMEIRAEDNANGSGIKTVSVTGLPDYLEYDSATNTIKFKTGKQEVEKLPENTPSKEFTLNIRAEDNAGNVSERTAKITVSSMSEKTNPTPIPQNTSYGQVPAPNASVDKAGLPEGTNVTWKTPPVVTVPGTTTGVVEVTYPDGSKDTVEVTVNVSKLSDEYNVAGTQIEVNQNDPVTNDDLKAKVTATSKEGNVNGTDKIAKVEPKAQISTVAYGETNIEATVTFKDGTTKEVTIPLKVKDVTKPTIQTPVENTNWEMTALDKTLPNMEIRAEDNANGSGIKTVSVTGLPDYLEYDSATNTIKFKTGKQEVEKLPENTPSKEFTLNIRAEDNAGNVSERTAKITVSSMSEKTNPTPIPQNTSYGQVPAPNASVDKAGLPEGTNVTWKTPPVVTVPGTTTGVVEVTYPDGSKDTVEVTVNVSKLSDEYNVAGTQIEVNQNDPVTNDDLKAKVTATSKEGNVNGTDKIAKVEPKAQISTVAYGETNIEATVTFKDGTTKEVTIPLKVKDVTKPTIQTPVENTNWEMTALDKTLPNMEIRAEDNANGSGIKTVSVTGLPDYLEYDSATNTIKFKTGKQEVEKLPENTPSKEFTLNIRAEDNAGNVSERTAKITVSSMSEKTNPTPIPQNTSYGQVPAPNASVDKAGLPEGTNVTWKTPPVVTVPGTTTGVVEVTYPDGSKDTVEVTVNVSKLSDEYNVAGTQIEVNQNDPVTNDDLKAKVTATSKEGNVNGTDKIAKVEPKAQISTVAYGETNIEATVTFKDGTTKEVTIPLKVKDVTKPTIQTPVENTNWEMTALDKTLPNMEIRAEDNANGSGIKTVSVTGLPDYLEYDSATNTIKFKTGKQEVEKLPENTPSKEFTLNIRAEDNAGNVSERTAKITVSSMSEKTNPTPIPQNTSYGQVPAPNASVDKAGLPEGTNVTWKTPPVVTVPGTTTGVVEVTYPDGSKDTVEVTVNVSKLSDEYNVAGTQIEVNQNDPVTNDDLKAKVTATSKEGNVNGTDKIAKVEPKAQISTVAYGETNIEATVTFKDGTTKEVTIPLKVKDVTKPTIQTPVENTNWEMTALDKTLPNMEIRAEDNANGSGIKTVSVTGLPDYLEYDSATNTIKFKTGKQEVEKLPENTPSKEFTLNIRAEDNAGNVSERTAKITVSSMSEKTNPTPIPQNTSYGQVPAPNASVDKAGLPEGTNVTWKTNPDVSTPGSHPTVALVHYPDGTVDEVEVPITVKEQKDTYNPTAKQPNQTAKHGSEPSAEGSINTDGLPSGTTYKWVEKPDTNTTPGNKPGKVLITYPDNSTEEVTVTVEVTPQKDDYNPQPKPQTVDNGTVPNAEDSVDKTGLPRGTTIAWKERPVVNTPGSHPTVALVTYPDGTVDEVTVPITVKEQKDTYTPTAKQPGQTAKHGSEPSAEGSINTDGLPSGTTYKWVEKPDTNTTPGNKPGKVLITYPDNSTEEVTVTVEVTPQKDDYDPQPKAQTVDNGTVPNAEDSVDKTGLPEGTRVTWKTNPDVSTPGSHPTVALVTYPDGTVDEVTVPITVKEQKDTYTPTAKQPGQTAKHGSDPSAEGSINTEGLPSGTTYKWVEKPDTNTTPGNKPGKVLITYPDNSTEEVTVTVEVTPQKDDYDPQPKAQTITNGDIPNAKDSIGNVKELPDGTKIEWKDRVVPSTNIPENVTAKITITYPDGTEDEVEVTIIVNKQTAKGDPEVQPALPEFTGGVKGDPEVQPVLPEFAGGVKGDPEVQPALPEFAGGVKGDPEVQPALPEYIGGVNGEPEVQPSLPEFAGGVKGDPEVQSALPEYTGGVNGEPEVQPALPEYTGGANDESEIRSSFRDKTSNVATKRLANTGQSQNNSELAGLGLAIVGLFAAIKRRKNEEE